MVLFPGIVLSVKTDYDAGRHKFVLGFTAVPLQPGRFFFLCHKSNKYHLFFFLHLDARYGAYFNTHFLFITPRNPSAGLITAIIFKTSTSKSHFQCNYTMYFRNWAICLVRNLISRRIFSQNAVRVLLPYIYYVVMAWSYRHIYILL